MKRQAKPWQWGLILLALATTLGPAFRWSGGPPTWFDPGWVEGFATFWALIGAVLLIRIEIRRDRDRDAERKEVAEATVREATERRLRETAAVFATTMEYETGERSQVLVRNLGLFPALDVELIPERDLTHPRKPVTPALGSGERSGAVIWPVELGTAAVRFTSIMDGRVFVRTSANLFEEICFDGTNTELVPANAPFSVQFEMITRVKYQP